MTYETFFGRCNRWSSALQTLGVQRGDRVAYIAPNTHRQLESFYAVPQIGAVLVPINFRLTAKFATSSTQRRGRGVRPPLYRAAVDSVREQLENVSHFIALDDADEADVGGWLMYEKLLADGSEDFSRPSATKATS
jgi:fatty-acyl-CoA synthase